VDYESLTSAGSIMGSGGMIVMDEGTCMVDVARYFTNFLQDESCGKCVTCREGTQRLFEILTAMTEGKGTEEDIATLEELGSVVRDTSLCGLGQTAPNPMLSTLKYFRDEYAAHIRDKRCPKALIEYAIDAESCTGCGLCKKNCPEEAVVGELKEVHSIVQERCIRCGICRDVCKFDAVLVR
jgi:Pyruvate/2-oxoacid:ferredoxin oxidoreductase delta subunit